MNMRYRLINGEAVRLAILAIGFMTFFWPGITIAQQYSGPESCLACHEKEHENNYRSWQVSGHPFALMKAEEARHRAIPVPRGYTWDDVSYVVGGYDKKALYLDSNGYFITSAEDADGNSGPGNNQYNLETGEWSDYHPGEVNLPFDCGSCHTTNYAASGNQDGLPGMVGTFDSAGVECEQCHGNGMTMSVNDSSAFCGSCHTRGDSSAVIPASDGFILNNGQYNELLAGPHDSVKCVTCHNPHKKSEFSIKRECTACHSGRVEDSYTGHSMADYGVECKDCHMPYATLAAQAAGPFEGDRRSHIFYINSDPAASMFNEAGDAVALDNEGNAAVTLEYACKRCHETADINELARHARNFHGKDTSASQLEYIGINPGLSGHWWGGPERNGEGFLIEVSDAGGVLVLVVSMYTYDNNGNQLWLIASGLANTGMTAELTVYITEGRTWGEDNNTADFTTVFGTATFTFPSCTSGSFTLTPNEQYIGAYPAIGYELFHDITNPVIACPTFINNAN